MSTVHYYDQLMTAAHASCRWLAAARFTEQGIIAGYRPARRPTDHAHCSLRAVNIQTPMIFTARRLAKRGICRRRVSVCVCVCHTPVLYHKWLCYRRGTARRACQYKFCNYKISLSCGIIYVILRLAVFTQYRSVTDTHTQRRTDRYTTTACTALA